MMRPIQIVQIGSVDRGGGAATVASALMQRYRANGHRVQHLVGRKLSDDDDVVALDDDDRPAFRRSGYVAVQRSLRRAAARHQGTGFGMASRMLRLATHPRAVQAMITGADDFDFPASASILDRLEKRPDVIHVHNLHGGYFDLRALATLSRAVPTVVTLHDMWLLTGHCAQSIDCDRWLSGCGQCGALDAYPAVRRDATAFNWRQKQDIYARSRLHVAAPSKWLRDRAAQSMLMHGITDLRVIPNGVPTEIFAPADSLEMRRVLGLVPGKPVIVVTPGLARSMWKDAATIRDVIARVSAEESSDSIQWVAIDSGTLLDGIPRAHVIRVPEQVDRRAMARYYQAADLYVHASHADSFPLTVLEAAACGAVVIATNTGGIAEQLRLASIDSTEAADATGVIVPRGDAERMARAVNAMLTNDDLRRQLGRNAAFDVRARFSLSRQADAYLAWFEELAQ